MAEQLGKVLLIANPVAQNGKGAEAAERATSILLPTLADSFEFAFTESLGHAVDLASQAAAFDTVIALGGDGVIHEVANGLMQIPGPHRPALGVLPVGSGNDYARSLGMSFKVDRACDQLLKSMARPVDVGYVNGQWFIETLSFGLDAAIALDTMERRTRTGRTGTILYMESGFDQIVNHLDALDYTMRIDGGEPVSGQSITFAVQIGPYYGGGFKVCPDAHLDDDAFDVCIAHPPITRLKGVYVFLRAKSGGHTNMKMMEMFQAKSLEISFSEVPPAQIDGERIEATTFYITMEHDALRVLMPPR